MCGSSARLIQSKLINQFRLEVLHEHHLHPLIRRIDYWRAVPPTSNTCLGSALSDDELLLLSPEELCKDRLSDEYFRLKVPFSSFHALNDRIPVQADSDGGDCRDVVRCDRAGLAGTIR